MNTFIECCVEYVDEYMRILYVTNTKLRQIESGIFVTMTRLAADKTVEAMGEGKVVLVPRERNNLIEVTDLFITDQEDLLQIKKDKCCFRARQHMSDEMAMLKALDFFEFTICNNKLASHGIFIHDDNREEKYIEIINSGDEKLIGCLETYLNSWDIISDIYKYYKDFKEFEAAIQSADSDEAVQELADNYHYMV